MKLIGFGAQNFRSFGSAGFLLREIAKINIFIGRNNSGKSNVLSACSLFTEFGKKQPNNTPTDRHIGATGPIVLQALLAVELPRTGKPDEMQEFLLQINMDDLGHVPNDPLRQLDHNFLERVAKHFFPDRRVHTSQDETAQVVRDASIRHLRDWIRNSLKSVITIPAIREIRAEDHTTNDDYDPSGRRTISRLRAMQHPVIGKESERAIFESIQTFVAELLEEPKDSVYLEIPDKIDDLYVTMHGRRLPLTSYGTGLHELVLLCSTLAIFKKRWICLEEPEMHLHPALIRRFIRFLNSTDNTYFITTHSNVLLDAECEGRVYHVKHDGTMSTITSVDSRIHNRAIIDDLAFRASDLVQTNGIIWVEGPSDRTYINRWLELDGSKFIEGINYSFMFYGGSLLAHMTLEDRKPLFLEAEFIELLQINRLAFVVIDSDLTPSKTKLRDFKTRVHGEIGADKCWITKGKEIENYLRPELIHQFLSKRVTGLPAAVRFRTDEPIENAMKRAVSPRKIAYNKVRDSSRLAEMMTEADLNSLDLKKWIKRIHETIKSWNN